MVLFLFTSYSIRIQENISQRKGIMTDETTAVLPAQDESSEEGNGSRKSMQERMDNFHCEEYQKYFPEDPHEAEYLRTLLSSGGRGAVERQKVLVKLSLASEYCERLSQRLHEMAKPLFKGYSGPRKAK